MENKEKKFFKIKYKKTKRKHKEGLIKKIFVTLTEAGVKPLTISHSQCYNK